MWAKRFSVSNINNWLFFYIIGWKMSKREHTCNISLLNYKNISFSEIIIRTRRCLSSIVYCHRNIYVGLVFNVNQTEIRNQTRHMNVGQEHDMWIISRVKTSLIKNHKFTDQLMSKTLTQKVNVQAAENVLLSWIRNDITVWIFRYHERFNIETLHVRNRSLFSLRRDYLKGANESFKTFSFFSTRRKI